MHLLLKLKKNPAPGVEVFFITEEAPSSPIITCTFTAQSQCWGNTLGYYPPQSADYFLTDNYNEETYDPVANNMGSSSAGFDFVTSDNTGYPNFAYGVYKVTSNVTNKYFYLDYRDYRIGFYGYYNPPSEGNDIDLWVKYKYLDDKFYYNTYNYGSVNYVPIENGQLLNFWDIKQKGTSLTELFPDYWDNCLAVFRDGNNHPKLAWGPYTGFNGGVAFYMIEKNINCGINWQPLTQTGNLWYDDGTEN